MNLNSLITAALVLSAVGMVAPEGKIKWIAMLAFVLLWLPLAHFGYGFYDELTVEKR